MNQILKFACVPFILSLALRYYITNSAGVPFTSIQTHSEIELWFYAASIVLLAVWFWHIQRPQCGRCGSYDLRVIDREELNQFHTVRKIQEKDNNGRTVTRHLNVTVAEMRDTHQCSDCKKTWQTEYQKDKR